jgi:hypothetical protein
MKPPKARKVTKPMQMTPKRGWSPFSNFHLLEGNRIKMNIAVETQIKTPDIL